VTGDWSEPLGALRWHWGEAYVINCLGTGRWTAERRDTHEMLRDQTPLGLRDQIIADYAARKVSRSLPGATRMTWLWVATEVKSSSTCAVRR
jgi:hypothetical protein